MTEQAPTSEIPHLPLGLSITSFDPAFSENPHGKLDELRGKCPVVFDEVLQRYVLTSAADIEAVLKDRDLSVDARKAPEGSFMRRQIARRDAKGEEVQPSMLQLDAPEHDRLRSLVNKAFTPRAVERIAPRVQEIADELLDKLSGQSEFDVIGDYSAPLPTIVIAEMLGIDPSDQKKFKTWSDAIIQGFNPFLSEEKRKIVEANGAELNAYVRNAVEGRRTNRGDDLISGMIAAEENGQQMSDQEIVTMVQLLLAAGNLTTTDLIGNGVYTLLQHPGELERLRKEPSLIVNAVEEMLRFDPPITQSGRLALSATTLAGGCPIPAGSSISPVLIAANHDPALNPDPHRFDITREEIMHFSFGGGRRYCLGANLARLEAQIAINTLVQRFPKVRLATEKVTWRTIPVFRGLESLPVRVD